MNKITKFDTKKSIRRARVKNEDYSGWRIELPGGNYTWKNKIDRIDIIRKRLPYAAIESISKNANLSVKQLLTTLGIPQTTYNKKKRDNDLLSERDSEVILLLAELLDFGQQVFNQEIEKFQRWLKKPNVSLDGNTPNSMFDSVTGIQEVKHALNRLEYGNMA